MGRTILIYIDGVSNHTQGAGTVIAGDADPFVIGGDGGYSRAEAASSTVELPR